MSTKSAATIVESSGKSVEFKQSEGLFSCLLEHEVKSTKASFEWNGKKITRDQWHEMLAFFQWTFDTEKSEAMVDLFHHPAHGWKIWAFPQKGGTSMTIKSIDNDIGKQQRATMFEGYEHFGTVHHHCGMSAFQSGTDTADEKNVNGIHITVGNLGSDKLDIHCRLYINKHRFDPNMSSFWDIGEDAAQKIEFITAMGFAGDKIEDKAARIQMCEKAGAGTLFSDLWRDNYILPEKFVSTVSVHGGTSMGGDWCCHCQAWNTGHKSDTCQNKMRGGPGKHIGRHSDEASVRELIKDATSIGMEMSEIDFLITEITEGEHKQFYQALITACADGYMSVDDLSKAYDSILVEATKISDLTGESKEEKEDAAQALKEAQLREYYGDGYQYMLGE